MRSKFIGVLFLIVMAFGGAPVSPAFALNGTLQESFSCPTADCATLCVGPGGQQSIDAYRTLNAWTLAKSNRLWLQTDDGRTIVLGANDRCSFGGSTTLVQEPVEVDPLPPTGPGCACVGNQCTPAGCNASRASSPK